MKPVCVIELAVTPVGPLGGATNVVTGLAAEETEPLEFVAVTITLYVVCAVNPVNVADVDVEVEGTVGVPLSV